MPPGPDPEPRPQPPHPHEGPPPVPHVPSGTPGRGSRPPQRPPSRAPRRQAKVSAPPRRHRHHGKASHARVGLVVIFVLLRVLDGIFLLGVPTEFHRRALSTIITAALWTTALLIAIWLRKPWARLILLALFGVNVLASVILFPMAFDYPALFTPLVASMLVSAGSFAWLSYSRDVHRLVSRDRE